MTLAEQMSRESRVANQIDGHYCMDWDEMAVSAWTPEYDCCCDFEKSRLGRIINWYVMLRFNFGWWWTVGRHFKKMRKDTSPFAVPAAILDGKEYSVGFLEHCGYKPPFDDFKAKNPEAVILIVTKINPSHK